ALTGHRGAVVTEHAYHGVTAAIADLSPEEWPDSYRRATTELISPLRLEEDVERAAVRLGQGGAGLAATFVDSGFTSDGIHVPSAQSVATVVERTHRAGGLFVADEVQAGHGRSGEHLWMFATYGIAPDIVTIGKPMGNGYPVAAVIARKEIVDRFAEQTHV